MEPLVVLARKNNSVSLNQNQTGPAIFVFILSGSLSYAFFRWLGTHSPEFLPSILAFIVAYKSVESMGKSKY